MSATLAAIIIFLGEAIVIYAEIVGAKLFGISEQPFWPVFFKLFMVITAGGWLLLGGYMLGQRAFKNIWVVGVISLTSILIMEPVLNYVITKQLPTKGALAGLVLGAIGLVAAIFWT